ncbi:MAG: MEDS domain-containing protein [Betaproteobacteria bacterium]
MDTTQGWNELVRHPSDGDHMVHLYQEPSFLAEAVAEYVGAGLRRGEAALVIAQPAQRRLFEAKGLAPGPALRMLDAEETLARFVSDGQPQWKAFHELVGGLIAELRLQYAGVRAYGEMVDVLWQRGEYEAAVRLEEYWNELTRLQTFSLLCAYRIDNLDVGAYRGPLDCVCKTHTHLIPARDYARFNDAVEAASRKVLDHRLAEVLLSLSAGHRPATHMPVGQATLMWLAQNMPRAAERVLEEVRARYAPSAA